MEIKKEKMEIEKIKEVLLKKEKELNLRLFLRK
jgi:hypothetical protein